MRKYDSYKDSGVEWIREVPSHWEVVRLKDCSTIVLGKMLMSSPPKDKEHLFSKEYYLKSRNIGNLKLLLDGLDSMWFNEKEKEIYKLRMGDIVMNEGGDIGKVALWEKQDYPCYIQNSVQKISPKQTVLSGFLQYWLYAMGKTGYFWAIVSQISIAHLTKDKLSCTPVIIPKLSEQRAIATYLDKKCGEIDKVISAQQKRIALLEELKQSIITHAVTKGLNPNAKMKASGVEWIGEVPSHWDTLRLRFVCELRNGYTPSKANPDFWTNGTIPWYRMEDIRESGRHLNEAKQYITKEAVKGGGLFEAGSFIMATTATIGEHAILIVDSLANQRFTNLKIRKSLADSLLKEFFFYYLFVVDDYCKTTTRTATFPAVNMEDLKNFIVCLPPINEQCALISFIKERSRSIDAAIAKANSKITLLQEYKQSLITEVVTGKRKVC